jgi:ADP-ribose pyrophosphatase YjhB (NUDIX family)
MRTIRYQGAIQLSDHLLLIKHREHADGRTYWLLPGGGRENGETEEACFIREIGEETHLDVAVERLLLDEPAQH